MTDLILQPKNILKKTPLQLGITHTNVPPKTWFLLAKKLLLRRRWWNEIRFRHKMNNPIWKIGLGNIGSIRRRMAILRLTLLAKKLLLRRRGMVVVASHNWARKRKTEKLRRHCHGLPERVARRRLQARSAAEYKAKNSKKKCSSRRPSDDAIRALWVSFSYGIINSRKPKCMIISHIQDHEWKFTKKTAIDYETQDLHVLRNILMIMDSAADLKDFPKPHVEFKKRINNSFLGKAGPGNEYWKANGTCGYLSHRLYDQLFKIYKKRITQ